MADFLKKIKDKAAEVVASVTGNSGGVGQAKNAIAGRKKRIDDEIDKADPPASKGMANGGLVGGDTKAHGGGRKAYGK